MFHIKICGVRLERDVDAAAESNADAIGLNFFSRSVRYVDPNLQSTRRLSDRAAGHGMTRVGVFVNEPVDAIEAIADGVGLDIVQLHGDEPLDAAELLIRKGRRVLRAIKLPVEGLTIEGIQARTAPWQGVGASILLDADAGSAHGGSGKTLDWETIRAWSRDDPPSDWVLAGGLTPENVGDAIRTSGAKRVDVASGVEEPRGVKSEQRIRLFTQHARRQWQHDGE